MKKICFACFSFVFLAVISLTSCSSGNMSVSSFSKRKYTKGYFFNRPAHVSMIAGNARRFDLSPHISAITTPISDNSVKPTNLNSSVPESNYVQQKCRAHNTIINSSIPTSSAIQFNKGDTLGASPKGETNFVAIGGCALSLAGVIITVVDGFMPILAIVFIVLGGLLCIYSFSLDKIYWTWLGIIGLSFIIILFSLLLL